MTETNQPVDALLTYYVHTYPEEAARHLDALPPDEIARLIEGFATLDTGAVLSRLRLQTSAGVLLLLSDARSAEVLQAMEPSRAAAALARLDSEEQDRRLKLLPPASASELRQLMSYAPDTAGGIMDPRVSMFRPDSGVHEALDRLRAVKGKRIHDVFVVDADGRLEGSAPLQDLAIADPEEPLGQLIRPTPSVRATASTAEVVDVLEQRRAASLPVVDFEGRLLGVIRYDALVTAAREEASVDMQTMVGASRDERALSTLPFAVRKRLPWLHVNLATAFLAAMVVGIFEGTIARFTALAVLLPVVAGQSGNTGAQALAVTMRGLALREIRLRHWLRIAFKEVGVGAVNGVAIALVTSVGVFLWSQSIGLAAVIGIAMVFSMIIAGMAGASVPMILTSLGQDPAQASSIILTTVTDVVGFLSFLGLATLAAGFL